MDLASGYWQVNLNKEDREKCALVTTEGLFEPSRMPQGLCNAPATFQRAMDHVLGDLKMSCVLIYLDNITVFSQTFTEHLQHLRSVFSQLCEHNLKLKADKCQFLKKQLKFLGHTVSTSGIQPQSSKIEAIVKMSPPTSLQDIQVFLGMTGYYRQFIPHYAQIAEPLVKLLQKDLKFNWTSEQQTSFQMLKDALVKAPILVFPDFNKTFYLYTNASDIALGSILSQLDEQSLDHPIAYYSRTFSKAERNYSVSERECLSVIDSVKHFRHFLHGVHFKVITDHSSLRWLTKIKDPDGCLARWAIKLQHYDYEIIHRPGATHLNADGLSQLPICYLNPEISNQIYDHLLFQSKWNHLPASQQKLLNKLSQNTKVTEGQLYKFIGNKWIPYPPPSTRLSLIREAHLAVGHGCFDKTYNQIKDSYYWESL